MVTCSNCLEEKPSAEFPKKKPNNVSFTALLVAAALAEVHAMCGDAREAARQQHVPHSNPQRGIRMSRSEIEDPESKEYNKLYRDNFFEVVAAARWCWLSVPARAQSKTYSAAQMRRMQASERLTGWVAGRLGG